MNEFPLPSEKQQTSPSESDRLQQLLENQEQILKNQKELLRAERNRRTWGIIRIIIILVLLIVPFFFLPALINSMMGDMLGTNTGGMSFDAILGNPDALEQLLTQ